VLEYLAHQDLVELLLHRDFEHVADQVGVTLREAVPRDTLPSPTRGLIVNLYSDHITTSPQEPKVSKPPLVPMFKA
jgi:hypothetical protein